MLAIGRSSREIAPVIRSAYFGGNLLKPAWNIGFFGHPCKKLPAYPQKMWTPCRPHNLPVGITARGWPNRPLGVGAERLDGRLMVSQPASRRTLGVSFQEHRLKLSTPGL